MVSILSLGLQCKGKFGKYYGPESKRPSYNLKKYLPRSLPHPGQNENDQLWRLIQCLRTTETNHDGSVKHAELSL
jgi:hypothetical protein